MEWLRRSPCSCTAHAQKDEKGAARRSFLLAEPPRESDGRSMRTVKDSLATSCCKEEWMIEEDESEHANWNGCLVLCMQHPLWFLNGTYGLLRRRRER